jgi:hypothetical protein
MLSFTTSIEAFDARDNGTPIMLDVDAIYAVLEYHCCDEVTACFTACEGVIIDGAPRWDAADILEFLGY